MKRLMTLLVAAAMSANLTGCVGGGGGYGGGGDYYTHTELAYHFVDTVNTYMYDYDLEIQKIHTEEYDYIVVYDYWADTYDAYYLGAYNPGESISNYLYNYDHWFYYDLVYIGGNQYEDYWSGTIFNKSEPTGKDLVLGKALKEAASVKKIAHGVQAQFGLSETRSRKWAEVIYKVDTAPEGSLTNEQVDNMATELIGSSISAINQDLRARNVESLSERLEKATELNAGMNPEQVNKVITEIFTAN